jgi:hypothetical protein
MASIVITKTPLRSASKRDYSSTIKYTSQALGLSPDGATRHKILVRKAKAHLYLREIVLAQEATTDLHQGEEKDGLQRAAESLQEPIEHGTPLVHHLKDARSLPYYKPQMEIVAEYYNVGHDKANSMLDPLLGNHSSENQTLSFFFGGIGDARHLLQTL